MTREKKSYSIVNAQVTPPTVSVRTKGSQCNLSQISTLEKMTSLKSTCPFLRHIVPAPRLQKDASEELAQILRTVKLNQKKQFWQISHFSVKSYWPSQP